MHCVVTAGPAYESLDEVRRLTNFSTGRLGTELAAFLNRAGHPVTLLRGQVSIHRELPPGVVAREFTSAADLGSQLEALAGSKVGAVFHAAAVSDFSFGKTWRRTEDGTLVPVTRAKHESRSGPLLVELVPLPKIIRRLRDWFPSATLVGWKYEVEGDRASALERGGQQMRDNELDACVVNGRAYGEGFGLCGKVDGASHLPDRSALFKELSRLGGFG
jgi:phosphopantothenoylcysteine decarboxylase/phosphopantothenate--cysteine ligase